MAERAEDDMPIMRTRLEVESGCSSMGGFDTFGSAWAWVSRSSTSWRAR